MVKAVADTSRRTPLERILAHIEHRELQQQQMAALQGSGVRQTDEEVVFRNHAGAELVSNAHRFVSRLAAGRFLGYLKAQKAAMTRR